jgi:hypothetical protein
MTGRVWKARSVRRGDTEFEVDGQVAVFVSLQHGVERPSLLMQRILATVAEHHGDLVADRPGINWPSLGWADQGEHDAMVADLASFTARWAEHPQRARLEFYIAGEKLTAGIPTGPPYTVDQLDELDRIIRRAPQVVAQDLAAESTAA